MAFRSIVIQSDARLSLRGEQLVIAAQSEASVPIEDIDTLLIESRQTTLSTALLSRLAQHGAAVFVCDEKHMPCALLLSYCQHSRQLEICERQLALTLPQKKRAWQQIVTVKIQNQAKCLELLGKHDGSLRLTSIAKTVRSGDDGHAEGHAAAQYFRELFGSGFTRSNEEDIRNSALNYGYAIIRGCVARSLTVHGLFPLFGLAHHNNLNQFNLADDFMEPFRPLADLFIAQNIDPKSDILDTKMKRSLQNLMNCDISVKGKRYNISYAIELAVQSFLSYCDSREKGLVLPELLPLVQHDYE